MHARFRSGLILLTAALALSVRCFAAPNWFALGPYGGDARSIAADPRDSKHLYLGTANGWVYESHDGGVSWARLAQISKRNDLVIDHIVVDALHPRRLLVGAWFIDHPDGGLFISEDGGKDWYDQAEMRGQSIRSMARSLSRPEEIVAGTLKGVFRSLDNGVHWKQISPEGSAEIHEVQSVAIDPTDGNIIYAGTWHLPWRTTDGGEHWESIKEGIIDDSDVFSIIIDPKDPKVIYASACSGIYKSVTGANPNEKDQGKRFIKLGNGVIPSSARRTRKLMQDPEDLKTVFAGTTEGLYRTIDGGAQWDRLTPQDVIINDVFVDPKNSSHVLLATDHGGVLRSEDGGASFEFSNTGFSARQVVAFSADPHNPANVYVGVVNDKRTGGVFLSQDGGVRWRQVSDGLDGRDVFSLLTLQDGTTLAGTAHGIFRLQDGAWSESSALIVPKSGEKKDEPVEARDDEKKRLPAVTETGAAAGKAEARTVEVKAVVRPAATKRSSGGRVVARHGVAGKRPAGKSASAKRKTSSRAGVAAKKHGAKAVRAPSAFVWAGGPMLLRSAWISTTRRQQRKPAAKPAAKKKEEAVETKPPAPSVLDAVVYVLQPVGDSIFAGTSLGLMRSDDAGKSWMKVEEIAIPDTRFLGVHGKTVFAGTLKRLAVSKDAGATWDTVALPKDLTQIGSVAVDEMGHLWVGGREGVYYSTDNGENWQTLRNLFLTQVDSIYSDVAEHRLLVTSSNSTFAFAVSVPGYKVKYWDTGWNLRFARPVGDHLIGATLFDGMVVQPRMVDSAFQ